MLKYHYINNTSFIHHFQVFLQGRVFFLRVSGIIAEFNPLHSGHKYLIDAARLDSDAVVCILSGNFTQRGDTAIISKHKRARLALLCGVDIVAELPVLWSMSTAQNFALGGVWQAYNLGCTELVFGSESGDIGALLAAADVLCGDAFSCLVREKLQSGITFAAARESAAIELGVDFKLLRNPNDNLGIEYICAALRLGLDLGFRCIKRQGAAHDSKAFTESFASASLIREHILNGNIGFAERFMPIEARGIIQPNDVSDIKRLETAILCSLRSKQPEDFARLPDISEGIENKLFFAAQKATSLESLLNGIKTKRYTLARIRRLVLSAFLGLDGEFFMKTPPYTRILGFSERGTEHIKSIKEPKAPIVTKVAQIKGLGERARKVLALESHASNIFALSLHTPLECGAEYKSKLLKTEELK